MSVDIVVPALGESVTEATVAQWLKKEGDRVEKDEPLVELETDKVTLEVNASQAGILSEILAKEGANVEVGALLARLGAGDGAAAPAAKGGNGKAAQAAKAPAKAPEPAAEAPRSRPAAAAAPPASGTTSDSGATSEITVPALGESVTEAIVARWLKAIGDAVARDEPVVELETDKVTLEVNAESDGVLAEIVAKDGETVQVGAVLARIGAAGADAAPGAAAGQKAEAPAEAAAEGGAVMPAARKLIEEKGLDAAAIRGTGKGGRILKEDVLAHLEAAPAPPTPAPSAAPAAAPADAKATTTLELPAFDRPGAPERPKKDREERVRMSKLRQTIAARLKQAQDTAAMLTTFNEVDMSALMAARTTYRDSFEKKHGVRLGFMSFFVKACILALKELPAVNAEIDGTDIVYKNYYDIGVAVGTPSGLVVPVIRDADQLSFAEVEKTIAELGRKARDGKLSMADLTGGTFTISNGGVYGSLMSTPILNPPQSAILGMHKIQDRPVVIGGKVEVRPMMYLAVSYDHRIVDGREAVTFLVRIKDCIEDPQRILFDV